jgi:hypothetical protein
MRWNESQEVICCRGHPLIIGTHPTTFEVTKEDQLTENGNCIVGIAADKGCAGLSPEFKTVLMHDDAILVTRLTCGRESVRIKSQGASSLTLTHPTDLVWRRSTFVCGRTIGIRSDHVALTLPRTLIKNLVSGEELTITLTVTRPCPGL